MEDSFSPNEEALFVLANQVAEAFEGSVTIEDLGRNVLAYSTLEDQLIDEVRTAGILMRKVPDDPENDRQYREVITSHMEVRFPPSDSELGRIAVAITAGTIPLGTLWVVDRHPEHSLTKVQHETLHQVATQAAQVLLRREHRMVTRDLPRKRTLLKLLTENLDTELREALIIDGFPRSGALVLLQVHDSLEPTEWQRLAQTVTTSLGHVSPSAVAVDAETGDVNAGLYVFIPGENSEQTRIAIEQLHGIVQRTGNGALRFIVASRFVRAEDLKDAHEYTRAFLRAPSEVRRTHAIVELAHHHSSIVSGELTAALTARPWLQSPNIVKFLEEHPDAAHTVHVWCEELGNVARTAKRLRIHENTVRFRLAKARTDYGMSLTTLNHLMAFVTQFRSMISVHLDHYRRDKL